MLKTGFARELITPRLGIPLCGYFNPRPGSGVYDDLFVKALIWDDGVTRAGVISYDLCAITTEMIQEVRDELQKQSVDCGENLLFCATHTHTGPYVNDGLNHQYDRPYMARVVSQTVAAVCRALDNLALSEMWLGKTENNPFAFNRRYFMTNGKVATNPGKLNPNTVKPEGMVDKEIGVIKIVSNGMITALLVNIVNHNDTIGGNLVSADWPNRLERHIQDKLGYDVPVIVLVGASGNINHFDVDSLKNQTSYQESCRIGKGYAEIILDILPGLKLWRGTRFKLKKTIFHLHGRTITDEEIHRAEEISSHPIVSGLDSLLTSEDLIKGTDSIRRCFAEQLLAYHDREAGKARPFELFLFDFGPELSVISIPGEPFTEIGLAAKKHIGRKLNIVIGHAQGCPGYLPLEDCYERGGYEILPVLGGGAAPGTAEKLLEHIKILATKESL